MSLSPVSQLNSVYSPSSSNQTSPLRKIRQDFDQLGQALSAGDLSGAQQAFAAYQQDLQGLQQASAAQPVAQNAQTTLQDAVSALGTALNAGDVSGAQKAFTAMQQALQHAGGHMHHHHPHAQAAQALTVAPGNAGDAASALNINTTA